MVVVMDAISTVEKYRYRYVCISHASLALVCRNNMCVCVLAGPPPPGPAGSAVPQTPPGAGPTALSPGARWVLCHPHGSPSIPVLDQEGGGPGKGAGARMLALPRNRCFQTSSTTLADCRC